MVMWNTVGRLSVGVLLLPVVFTTRAEACSCIPSGPPCQNYFRVDAVFIGTVRAIDEIEGDSEPRYHRRSVHLTIDRALRGISGSTTDAITGMGGGDCGYSFVVGRQYLVYAYRRADGMRLEATICSRTRPIEDAGEDLTFIGELADPSRDARVFGTITHAERDLATGEVRRHPPVPFIPVLLQGPSGTRETQTDKNGRYEITAPGPGTYNIRVSAPPEFNTAYLESNVELRDTRACAAVDFWLRYDGRVTGVAVNAAGEPAAGVSVELRAAASQRPIELGEVMTTKTDAGGYFAFGPVPPGQYVIGVTLRRMIESEVMYPRTFYRRKGDSSDATVVNVGPGEHQQLDPLRLPRAAAARTLSGRVVWPDGSPVSRASVWLTDGDKDWQQVAVGTQTDSDGRFTFVVHDGFRYAAHASYRTEEDPTGRRELRVKVGPLLGSARLRPIAITMPWVDNVPR
jgi:hypothetical protein